SVMPSNFGARGIHAACGVPPASLSKKFPTPTSVNAAPAKVMRNPNEATTTCVKTRYQMAIGGRILVQAYTVNSGATKAAFVDVVAACVPFAVPSRWHMLHLALPRNSSQPAISSPVSVALPASHASNLDENGLMASERS